MLASLPPKILSDNKSNHIILLITRYNFAIKNKHLITFIVNGSFFFLSFIYKLAWNFLYGASPAATLLPKSG